MVLFLFVGEDLLGLFGVNVASFAVAGSLVLFFLALEMILGVRIYREAEPESASIVPIAFPLIAGAGTLTTLISIRSEYEPINILIAIVINSVLVFVVLKNTRHLERWLGKNGIASSAQSLWHHPDGHCGPVIHRQYWQPHFLSAASWRRAAHVLKTPELCPLTHSY